MPFKKGQSGNPNGRPKGKENKSTKELRQRVTSLIDSQIETILEDFQSLTPKERIDITVKLFEYVIPKLSRKDTSELELENREPDEYIDLDKLSRETLLEIEAAIVTNKDKR